MNSTHLFAMTLSQEKTTKKVVKKTPPPPKKKLQWNPVYNPVFVRKEWLLVESDFNKQRF